MARHCVFNKSSQPHTHTSNGWQNFSSAQKHEEEMLLCNMTGRYVFLPAGQLVCTVLYFSHFRDRRVDFESDLCLITINLRERFLTKYMHSGHSKLGNLIQKHCVTY